MCGKRPLLTSLEAYARDAWEPQRNLYVDADTESEMYPYVAMILV